jgi:hypothetical protein
MLTLRATQKPAFAAPEPFMAEEFASAQLHYPHQPLTSQSNGAQKALRSNMYNSQQQPYDEERGCLVPNQAPELLRTTSEPDSVLDFYNTDSKNGSSNAPKSSLGKGKKKRPADGVPWVEAEKDQSNWIHRDKLKEIESKELEEFGYRVGRGSRSNSRSQSASRKTRDRKDSEATAARSDEDRYEHRRIVSPILGEEEEVGAEPVHWDPRTADEIMAERDQFAARNNAARPGTSRIPIAKLSALPVPANFVERDQPLPRPRRHSANWSGESFAVAGARVRSGSVSSQVLLDDPRLSKEFVSSPRDSTFPTNGMPSRSPQKAKTPSKPTPTSGNRKTSAPRSTSQAKPRTASATTPKRPGTSGGTISRPTTSHRPEGEAPWIATMYKPDPRLPPDQQIIPTHAKRMQQEQWQNEGKTGSIYDKEFKLLNADQFEDKRASQIIASEPEKQQEPQQPQHWPLSSPTKPTLERVETNPRSPTEQAGYKLTPTIPQSPRVPSRASERRVAPPITSQPTNMTRLPEPPITEEKEKKGLCCIVM